MSNPLCHFEFMSRDPEKFKAFYSTVFDWSLDDVSMPGYTLINAGAEPSGGMFPSPDNVPTGCVNVYFMVEDIKDTLEQAKTNGAKVLIDKTEIPRVGHIAMISDPEGICVGLMQSNR